MKRFNRIITVSIAAALAIIPLANMSYADGSYSVDTTYIQLKPGETGSIVISADNAAGRVNWSSEGVINESGSAFLDNGYQTIEFTAQEAGTAYINVAPDPQYGIATYDNEELDYGYTIQIEVVDDSPAAVPNQDTPETAEPETQAPTEPQEETTTQEPETTTTAPEQTDEQEVTEDALMAAADDGTVLTDGNNDYADLSEEDRLYTNVDGQELYIIQYPLWQDENGGTVWNDEIFNLDRLTGFDYETVNYKGLEVDVFTYKDLPKVFVLKNLETDVSQYYMLGESAEGFKPLPYVTVNGRQYIVEGFPESFTVPEGYSKVDMTLGSSTVQALKPDGNPILLKGYDIKVSPGLESKDPVPDLYYIYCLVDGETQLYSYDSGEGTLQRASILVYDEIPVEPETVIVYEPAPEQTPAPVVPAPAAAEPVTESNSSILKGIGWDNMQIQVKVLLIALAVAIILIIILIISLAVSSHRTRKARKALANTSRKKSHPDTGRRSQGEQIPPRQSSGNDEEDSMFSYVKTEKDEFDIDNLK